MPSTQAHHVHQNKSVKNFIVRMHMQQSERNGLNPLVLCFHEYVKFGVSAFHRFQLRLNINQSKRQLATGLKPNFIHKSQRMHRKRVGLKQRGGNPKNLRQPRGNSFLQGVNTEIRSFQIFVLCGCQIPLLIGQVLVTPNHSFN